MQEKLVVISPVRDEERYIEATISSMMSQTIKPEKWIIVNDGSTDRTGHIIEEYGRRHDWIRIIHKEDKGFRNPGGGVIEAFNHGYRQVKSLDHQYVAKLDCDISFHSDYFERLIQEFAKNKKLGIASGIYLEHLNGKWRPISMPSYHAAGASKILRKECFDQIGGFIAMRGWDTVDEIKAQFAGWETCHFKNLKFLHHKIEGTGIGPLKTSNMHGDIYYLTGGSLTFFILKCIHRMLTGRPPVLAGVSMLIGYLSSLASRKPKLLTVQEEKYYKKVLNSRIRESLSILKRSF
jgi:glycosyltransferase involved in cell wall biosynthesis